MVVRKGSSRVGVWGSGGVVFVPERGRRKVDDEGRALKAKGW
jgi:hypothetical protein